jgi:hypothetical protein
VGAAFFEDRVQASGLTRGSQGQAVPGDAYCRDPGGEEIGITVAVALELLARAMDFVPVELDDQAMIREEDVRFVADDLGVDPRLRQVVAVGEEKEGILEFRARGGTLGLGDLWSQPLRRRRRRVAVEQLHEVAER